MGSGPIHRTSIPATIVPKQMMQQDPALNYVADRNCSAQLVLLFCNPVKEGQKGY